MGIKETTELMRDLLEDLEGGHTEYQLARFVVARSGAGTLWGRYRQTLRELRGRVEAIETAEIERRKTVLRVEELHDELGKVNGYEKRRLEIELDELALTARRQEHTRVTLDREREFFYRAGLEMKKALGSLTEERRAELDREFWLVKLRLQAAIERASVGRIQPGTLETIAALAPEDRAAVLEVLHEDNAKRLIEEQGCEVNGPGVALALPTKGE